MSNEAYERLWLVVTGIAFYSFVAGLCLTGFLYGRHPILTIGGFLGAGAFVVLQIFYVRKTLRSNR